MGRVTILRRKNLTKSGLKQYIKPYLLRNLSVISSNQVWCTVITYIPMKHGYLYLTAYIDVYSRKIVGWGLSNAITVDWCLDVLKRAISQHGGPEIINRDQGSQYTSSMWQSFMEQNGIQISMDGKCRALDNIWIERFWK
jgi:putative transposase